MKDPRQRERALLFHSQGLTAKEIAERLEETPKSVRTLLGLMGLTPNGKVGPHGALVEVEALDDVILALRKSGLAMRRVAKEVGLSESAARYRMRKINANLPASERVPTHRITRSSTRTWDDEALRAAVAEGNSVADCIRALGLSETSARNWQVIKSAIAEAELSTEHWTRNGRLPSTRIPLPEIMVENSSYQTGELRKRLLSEGVMEHRCTGCRQSMWMGQSIPLELDHVNGVPNDHRPHNLRLLCPNCHALTPTWRGRKNRKRSCSDCQVPISKRASRCSSCAGKSRSVPSRPNKIDWPPPDALEDMVTDRGYEATGRSLGVSGTAVRKRVKRDAVADGQPR